MAAGLALSAGVFESKEPNLREVLFLRQPRFGPSKTQLAEYEEFDHGDFGVMFTFDEE